MQGILDMTDYKQRYKNRQNKMINEVNQYAKNIQHANADGNRFSK